MPYGINQVTVIGAGTMGAAIAGHLANAGMPVTLLDKGGNPQSGAGVVATYLSTGEEVVFPTDGNGVAVVTDKGPGVVRVKGQFNDLTTDIAELTFVGGECSTSVSPRSATLQLK